MRLTARNSSLRHSSDRGTALMPVMAKSGEATWRSSAVRSPKSGAATTGAPRKITR